MNKILWKVAGLFFKSLGVAQKGMYEEDGKSIGWEKFIIDIEDYRVYIVVEEILDGKEKITAVKKDLLTTLEDQIQDAIEEEDYLKAQELTEKLKQIKDQDEHS